MGFFIVIDASSIWPKLHRSSTVILYTEGVTIRKEWKGMWASAGDGAFLGPASEDILGPRPLPHACHQGSIWGSEGVVSGSCKELVECQICLNNSSHLDKLVVYYCGFSPGMKFGAMRSGARWEQEKVSS